MDDLIRTTRISIILSSMVLLISTNLFAQTHLRSLDKKPDTVVEVNKVDKITSSYSGFISPKRLSKTLNRPVNDFTDTLSKTDIKKLEKKIRHVYDSGLLQIGVVLVPTTGKKTPFDYGMEIADNWALGSPENNNGVLILIAMNDHDIYILTGTDVEATLTDTFVKRVIDTKIVPNFQQKQYAQGINLTINTFIDRMKASAQKGLAE